MSEEVKTEKKTRTAAVSEKKFFQGYIAGCKAGKTRTEIAADLGMTEDSFRQREGAVRKVWKPIYEEKGMAYPMPKDMQGKGNRGEKMTWEAMQDLLKENDFLA